MEQSMDGATGSRSEITADPDALALPVCPDADAPPCEFLLSTEKVSTEKGIAIYWKLASLLSASGRLNPATHLALSTYALLVDTVHRAQIDGRPLRASWFAQMRFAEQGLGLADLARPPTPARPEAANRFARFGFASRNQMASGLWPAGHPNRDTGSG
jgi:hypothetical protein